MGGPGWISGRDEPFRGRFERLLTSAANRDLTAGFSLAADLGRPAVPMLWQMLLAERSNVARRNALLAAAMIAGGPAEDERLFDWLGQQKSIKEERAIAALGIALGPPRSRPVADFWTRSLGPTKSPEQILAIAVRLAAARLPLTDRGAPALTDDGPGLAGATAYAGLPVSSAIWNRRWDLRSPKRHDELFWRGALLCGARLEDDKRPIADDLLRRARDVAALGGDQYAAARAAAALLRARRGDVRCVGARPDYDLLELLASDRASAVRLRPWLGPVPQPRDERPERLAVSYVLSRDPHEVVAEAEAWSRDARVNRHIAVAVAWRLLGEDGPKIEDVALPGLPEWFFARWAAGRVATPARCEDPALTTMAQLAADGRMPRAAARQALEEALWRWGSHPGLGMCEAERLLIRDMLLVGSNQGGKYVPHIRWEQRYRPTGIGHAAAFFDAAVALYDFFRTPTLPLPPQYRLR